jgi:hypothetical protein
LKVKFLIALGLVRQHKLHIVDANKANVMSIYRVLKSREDVFHAGTSIEVHEMEGHLLKLLKVFLSKFSF